MQNNFRSMIALSLAIAPGMSHAVGLGEVSMVSRIGERLLAEVAIIAAPNEKPEARCFSLAPLKTADLPVVTAAQVRVTRRGQDYILQIVGNHPISEPIFTISLRVACGYDLERDYVLMPEAPMQMAESPAPAPLVPAAGPGRFTERAAHEGESLADMAAAQAPADLTERQRILARLAGANPDIDPNTPLSEGTTVLLPARKRPKAPHQPSALAAQAAHSEAGAEPPATPRPVRRPDHPKAASGGNDRLILGVPGESDRPPPKGRTAPVLPNDAEERLLKLETTLHQLTQEVEKMDQALALASQLIEAQNKLQQATSLQPSPPSDTVAVPTRLAPANPPAKSNWLELILSAILGAGISIGLARHFGQRKQPPGEIQPAIPAASQLLDTPPPLAAPQAAQPSSAPVIPPPPGIIPIPTAASTVFSNTQAPYPPVTEGIELREEDDRSMLDLAEVMLSFGRVRGATDTLAEYVAQTLPTSFQPWRMLLDLYRRAGDQAAFESLAQKIRSRFNANIPDWADLTLPISGLKSLEDFPHVLEKIDQTWGSQTCFDYLYGLTHDNRAGQRSGFPLEVVEEIALLMQVLEMAYKVKRKS